MKKLKSILDQQAAKFDSETALFSHADPLQIVYENKNSKDFEIIALLCALFAYGNANLILRHLKSLDFSLLNASDAVIQKSITQCYRFQNSSDIAQIFITLKRLKNDCDLIQFINSQRQNDLLCIIHSLISKIYSLNPYRSHGYEFFFGKVNKTSPYKRYCMYFRWMCRGKGLDFKRFDIDASKLLIPLDTHICKMSRRLGLLTRKQNNQQACIELSQNLRILDANDPLKYDFALYRLSQTLSETELKKVLDGLC